MIVLLLQQGSSAIFLLDALAHYQVFLNALAFGLNKSDGIDKLKEKFMAIKIQGLVDEETKIITDRNKKLQNELFANKD